MDFNKIVKEEMDKMIQGADENAPKIEKELEKLRKKFESEIKEIAKKSIPVIGGKASKRVELATVSKIIDFPVHELMLYFINQIKNAPDGTEKALVQYHLGCVYFYAKDCD